MALEALKISNAPAAFAEFAAKHNALVELIGLMRGVGGINVHSTRGGLVLSGNPTGMSGAGQSLGVTSGGGGGGNVGNTTQAVGVNGLLYDVLQPVSPSNATNYPNLLRAGDTFFYAQANANAVSVSTFGVGASELRCNFVSIAGGGYAAALRAQSNEGLYLQKSGGSTYLFINEADITRIMGVKQISVCDNGNARNMLIIGSDPF